MKAHVHHVEQKQKLFLTKLQKQLLEQEVIRSKILKNHGCSGVTEIEYRCSACGLKEVHQVSSAGCNL